MLLGSYLYQKENLNTEYKEFCFKLNLKKYYDNKAIRLIITHGVFDDFLNTLIIKNLEVYIAKYVPRYLTSFHNTKFSKQSFLYIGVDDCNEITGIPYNGDLGLHFKYLNELLSKTIQLTIPSTCCTSTKLYIYENTVVPEIINDYNVSFMLNKCYTEKKEFDQKYRKYKTRKEKWIIEMYKYKGKLEDLMNDELIRLEFIEFLEEKNLLTYFKNLLLVKKFEIDVADIKYCKKNTNSYIYWLLMFKDHKVQQLLKKKPKEPVMPRILNVELNILTQLKYLRNLFIKKRVRYFTLKIEFLFDPKCINTICYTDLKTLHSKTIKRVVKSCGPACSNM
jgi:hypothetical protein